MIKYLFVPIEVKTRELDSRLFLSLKLISSSNSHWNCIIGGYKGLNEHWLQGKYSPFIFVASGIEGSEHFFKYLYEANGRYVLVDEEGGIFIDAEDKYPRGGFNHPCLKYVERVFFWGQSGRADWQSRHKDLRRDTAIVTGNPRFDLSKPEWHPYYKKISDRAFSQPYILINTAFGSVNALVDPELEIQFWERSGLLHTEDVRGLMEPLVEYESKQFPLFLSGLSRLFEALPQEQFVIRPHPVEDPRIYHEKFSKYSNVVIIIQSSVQEWLTNAKMVIHNGCTTAVEAYFSDVQPICYAPYIIDDQIHKLTFGVSEVVTTYRVLLQAVLNNLNDNKKFMLGRRESISKIVKPHIDNVDTCSVDKIVCHIDAIEMSKEQHFNFDHLRSYRDYFPRSVVERLANWKSALAKSAMNLPGNRRKVLLDKDRQRIMHKRDRIKFPGLTKEELTFRIAAFSEVDQSIVPTQVKELSSGIFIISRNR